MVGGLGNHSMIAYIYTALHNSPIIDFYLVGAVPDLGQLQSRSGAVWDVSGPYGNGSFGPFWFYRFRSRARVVILE